MALKGFNNALVLSMLMRLPPKWTSLIFRSLMKKLIESVRKGSRVGPVVTNEW